MCVSILASILLILFIEKAKLLFYQKSEAKYEKWQNPDTDCQLETRELSKTYSGDVKAVQGINLNVHKNEILGLLGANGAGKSSTFNMVTMQIKRT
jgi:ABC-type uncharacterized transport system ATPase subunit